MLFDAGCWGLMEVDEKKQESGFATGLRHTDDGRRELYLNYGNEGCTRTVLIRTQTPGKEK